MGVVGGYGMNADILTRTANCNHILDRFIINPLNFFFRSFIGPQILRYSITIFLFWNTFDVFTSFDIGAGCFPLSGAGSLQRGEEAGNVDFVLGHFMREHFELSVQERVEHPVQSRIQIGQ